MKICSFCGKKESEAFKLVFGPSVAICDECAALSHFVCEQAKEFKAQNEPS